MSFGSVQTLVICIPGNGAQGVCPAGQTQSVTQAYLIASSESQKFDLVLQPFDSAQAGAYFGFAFTTTIFLYLVSLGAGSVISFLRQA